MPHGKFQAESWKRKEFHDLQRALVSDDSSGAIVSGEVGTGKAMLLRSVLDSPLVTLPTVRLICSPGLRQVPYAALAPLLVGGAEQLDDSNIVHHAMSSVQRILAEHPGSKQVLIVVDEAQFIDPASVFVLGQLVNSRRIKFVALRDAAQHEQIASDPLNSVIRLERIVLYPLDAHDVGHYAYTLLGTRLSRCAIAHIHRATSGLQVLVEQYLKLLERQGALQTIAQRTVIRDSRTLIDSDMVETVHDLHRRLDGSLARALEILSLAGPVGQQRLNQLGITQHVHLITSSLLVVSEGTISIGGKCYAQALRKSIRPGRSRELYELVAPVLNDTERANPEFVLWGLSLGEKPNEELVFQAIKRANLRGDFQASMQIWELGLEEQDRKKYVPDRVRSLLGSGQYFGALHFVDGLVSGTAQQNHFVDEIRQVLQWLNPTGLFDPPESVQPSNSQLQALVEASSNFADIALISKIIALRQRFNAGDGSSLVSEADYRNLDQKQTILPAISYQAEVLVLDVRYLIESGHYSRARERLADFLQEKSESLGDYRGAVQALQAYALVRQGKMRLAKDLAADALAELSVSDPLGLMPLSLLVSEFAGVLTPQATIDQIFEMPGSSDLCPISTRGFWSVQDKEMLRLLHLLNGSQDADQITEVLQGIDPGNILLHHTAHFLVWRHTVNQVVRDYAAEMMQRHTESLSPLMHRQRIIVQQVQQGDPAQLRELVQKLDTWGEVVLALEVLTDIAQIWTEAGDARKRGLVIRQILLRLEEQAQEPWGVIARTVKDSELTSRESEIVDLVCSGLNNRDIARELTVSQRTVEGHMYRIFTKLGISQRSELTRRAAAETSMEREEL